MDRPLSCARRVLFVATMSTVLASCEPSRSAERQPLAMRRDLRAACDSGLRYPYFLEFRDSNAAGVTVYVFQPSDSVCYPPVSMKSTTQPFA